MFSQALTCLIASYRYNPVSIFLYLKGKTSMAFFTEDTDTTKGSHYKNQMCVVEYMNATCNNNPESRNFEIDEISRGISLDEKETLRTLYVLEGLKLVQPCPPGDFTSKIWKITLEGCKLAKTITESRSDSAKQETAFAA